jgi:hypothetical protein
MIIPGNLKPYARVRLNSIDQNDPTFIDVSALSKSPAGALITCYEQQGNSLAGIGLNNDQNCYSLVLSLGQSVFIPNRNSLNDLYVKDIGTGTSVSLQITFFEPV